MWLGLGLVLAPMLFRAITQTSTLPYWDMDPLLSWSPMVGIGPAGSLLVDALIILGAGLLIIGTAHLTRGAGFLLAAALVAIGCVPIVYHGWSSTVFTLGQQRIGASWASAMIAGMALWHAGTDRRVRIVTFAAIVGLMGLLAIRGIEQVFVEHPAVVENFKRNRDSILAANGWTPDSPMARGYERRLMQAEATGWFGLSNVYASFAAMGVAAFAGLAWSEWRRRIESRDRSGRTTQSGAAWPMVFAVAGLLASLLSLVLADSKGGFVACGVGLGVLFLAVWWCARSNRGLAARWSRFAPAVGPALVAAALLGVVLRGVVGERLGELSLLFRWFYMQAATRIAVEWPWLGVGPDGFKDAYLIFKNPLSPEEVGSPHSLLLDWWACLGAAGLAWVALLTWWLVGIGRNLATGGSVPPAGAQPPIEARPLIRAVGITASLAALAAIWTESAALVPEAAAVRVFGLLAWLGLSVAGTIIMLRHQRWVIAACAAALVLALHGQIEVTGSLPQSAGLFLAIIAVAASRAGPIHTSVAGERAQAQKSAAMHTAMTAIGAGVVTLAAWLGVSGCLSAWRWERGLTLAAAELRPIGEASQWLDQYRATRSEESLAMARATLAAEVGEGQLGEDLALAMKRLTAARINRAAEQLMSLPPLDWRTSREAARLGLLGLTLHSGPQREQDLDVIRRASRQLALTGSGGKGEPQAAARSLWIASVDEQLAVLTGPESGRGRLEIGMALAEQASKLDPYNLLLARRVLRMLDGVAPNPLTAQWARRVLELDDLQRLDRTVRGLSAAERREVEELVKRLEAAPKPTPTNP